MSKSKITDVPVEPKYEYKFVCRKCGNIFGSEMALTSGKFSGSGVGFSKLTVCKNCMLGNEQIY